MKFNEVSIPEDADFASFRRLCDDNVGWELAFSKKTLRVWTKSTPETTFRMIKVRVEFADVPASVTYDVLHDPIYRSQWDKYMLDGKDIASVSINSDICYYAAKSPKPFRHRDFILQRMWLDTPTDMVILNHSVCHDDYQPKKGLIRAISYITGYLLRPLGQCGCQITYISQSDPRGSLPSWAVNKLTQIVAPSILKKLHKACLKYPSWKAESLPNFKPWLFPEQQALQRVDFNKCKAREYKRTDEFMDESLAVDSAADVGSDDEWTQNGNASPKPGFP